jgi:hypothetical protein
MRTAKSCGPDAPMAGVKFLRSSRFPGATVTNKPWSRRGEHEDKPSNHCAGKAGMLPLNLYARVRFLLRASWHMRPRVQRAPGLPCVPLGIALRPLLRVACALSFEGRCPRTIRARRAAGSRFHAQPPQHATAGTFYRRTCGPIIGAKKGTP